MDDLVLHSTLTEGEIEENFKGMDFFSALTRSLEEAIAYENNDPVPETVVHCRKNPDAYV